MTTFLWPEALTADEIRVIAIDVAPDTPLNATYRVDVKGGATVRAEAAATIVGSIISCTYTIPSGYAEQKLMVVFEYDIAGEHFIVGVQLRIE